MIVHIAHSKLDWSLFRHQSHPRPWGYPGDGLSSWPQDCSPKVVHSWGIRAVALEDVTGGRESTHSVGKGFLEEATPVLRLKDNLKMAMRPGGPSREKKTTNPNVSSWKYM